MYVYILVYGRPLNAAQCLRNFCECISQILILKQRGHVQLILSA